MEEDLRKNCGKTPSREDEGKVRELGKEMKVWTVLGLCGSV